MGQPPRPSSLTNWLHLLRAAAAAAGGVDTVLGVDTSATCICHMQLNPSSLRRHLHTPTGALPSPFPPPPPSHPLPVLRSATAVEGFICDTFGRDVWLKIIEKSHVDTSWVSSCPYPDKVTYDVVITGAEILGVTVPQVRQLGGVAGEQTCRMGPSMRGASAAALTAHGVHAAPWTQQRVSACAAHGGWGWEGGRRAPQARATGLRIRAAAHRRGDGADQATRAAGGAAEAQLHNSAVTRAGALNLNLGGCRRWKRTGSISCSTSSSRATPSS